MNPIKEVELVLDANKLFLLSLLELYEDKLLCSIFFIELILGVLLCDLRIKLDKYFLSSKICFTNLILVLFLSNLYSLIVFLFL